jgi:hypothetical protein
MSQNRHYYPHLDDPDPPQRPLSEQELQSFGQKAAAFMAAKKAAQKSPEKKPEANSPEPRTG